ncbi:MAG: serine hydrolase domain-containing protein [Hyphomonadaceae bacterium]
MPHLSRRAALFGIAGSAALSLPGCGRAQPLSERSSAGAFPRVQALIDGYIRKRKLAGISAALSARSAPTAFLNAGTLAFDADAPARPDSLYRLYSMTKPVTGFAAMLCVEDGRLSLDQPIADFIPEFASMRVLGENGASAPARTQITPRHLLTHTAGFTYHFFGTPLAERYLDAGISPDGPTPILGADRTPPPQTLDEFGARLAAMPLDFEPGTRWQYSLGLDLLALVIQRASGLTYEQFLTARLFAPLGMADTAFYVAPEKVARLTTNYGFEDNGEVVVVDDRAASPYATPSMPCGGAGLVSSAADYARFSAMLRNGGELDGTRVAATATVDAARSNLLPRSVDITQSGLDGGHYGAGLRVVTAASAVTGEEPAGSFGWSGAAGTQVWVDPANQAFAVLMTQFMPFDTYPLSTEFRNAFYADIAA